MKLLFICRKKKCHKENPKNLVSIDDFMVSLLEVVMTVCTKLLEVPWDITFCLGIVTSHYIYTYKMC